MTIAILAPLAPCMSMETNRCHLFQAELPIRLQLRKFPKIVPRSWLFLLRENNSTPLLGSVDGVLPDGSIINYTPNSASNQHHSCWTAPKSRPPPNAKYTNGTCSVCMVRRQGTDRSSDYQLWARDDDNNAMGNLYATTMWPIDAAESPSNNVGATMLMGGSNLLV